MSVNIWWEGLSRPRFPTDGNRTVEPRLPDLTAVIPQLRGLWQVTDAPANLDNIAAGLVPDNLGERATRPKRPYICPESLQQNSLCTRTTRRHPRFSYLVTQCECRARAMRRCNLEPASAGAKGKKAGRRVQHSAAAHPLCEARRETDQVWTGHHSFGCFLL